MSKDMISVPRELLEEMLQAMQPMYSLPPKFYGSTLGDRVRDLLASPATAPYSYPPVPEDRKLPAVCTCPSGDGSLRWPCPVHPPEPVAWMYKREGGELLGQLVQMESDDLKRIRLGKFYDDGPRYIWPREDYIEWIPLYRHPPAQAPVVLPKRREEDHYHSVMADRAKGWNEYDDEFKRLNPTL